MSGSIIELSGQKLMLVWYRHAFRSPHGKIKLGYFTVVLRADMNRGTWLSKRQAQKIYK